MDIEEIPASIKAAFTDNRVRYKYAIISQRSDSITEDELNTYGQLGWEIVSMTERVQSDRWGGSSWHHTTIILKYPYQLEQETSDGQS